MQIRLIKVIRDLLESPGRTLVLIAGVCVGIFGIGSVLGSFSVLQREMSSNYSGTNPASATLVVREHINDSLLIKVRSLHQVAHAERRATVTGRMLANARWYPILLFVIDDFTNASITKPHLLSGDVTPAKGTMLVERTALFVMYAKAGDAVMIRLPGDRERSVQISGIVHDPGLAPAWQEQAGYGYITIETLQLLGGSNEFHLLRIRTTDVQSRETIMEKAEAVAVWLERRGYHVDEIQIPPPGQHPHQSQMNTVLTILIIFAYMILILASILVASTLSTIMVRHARHIAIMKTIGASPVQISVLYLLMIMLICVIALVIGIPLSYVAADGFNDQVAMLLNLELLDRTIPVSVIVIQIASGVGLPVIFTAIPIFRASRTSIRKALDYNGGSMPVTKNDGANVIRNEILNLALRNIIRYRKRMSLTSVLLAMAGAIFMCASNLSAAWDKSLAKIYQQRLYDVDFRVADITDTRDLMDRISTLPDVRATELWGYAPTSALTTSNRQISRTYPDTGHGSFGMLAVPDSTSVLVPALIAGKWISGQHHDAVVLNQGARGTYSIGDKITLGVYGVATTWTIIGFTEDVGTPAMAYVSLSGFNHQVKSGQQLHSLRVAFRDRSQQSVISGITTLEALLTEHHVTVSSITPVWQLRNAIAGHMRVMINSLIAMAIMMGVVGAISLASVTSINVFERTREFGVMRAIGATPRKIRSLITTEVLIVGAISFCVGWIVSLPLSFVLSSYIGRISFRLPLPLTLDPTATWIWLGILIGGSIIASLLPSYRAMKLTIPKALGSE